MTRPLLKCCIAFMTSLVFAIILPIKFLATVAVILAAAVVLLFILSKCSLKFRNCAILLLFSLLSIGIFVTYSQTTVAAAQSLSGNSYKITATVLQTEISSKGSKYYVAELNTVGGKDAPRGLKVNLHTANNDNLTDYDEISAVVTFFENSDSSTDLFYRANSVLATAMSVGDIEVTNPNEFSLLREICKIRDKIIFNIRASLPSEEGNILCGILFGKRDYISDQTTDLFASAGISHLLAVSGLHLSIIVMLINLLLTRMFVKKVPRSIICIILTAVLSVMIGFTPSIMRSAIMLVFMLTAQCIREDYDAPSILAFSAVVICLIEPYAVVNIGFLLSFSATAGLLISQSVLQKFRRKFSLKTVSIPKLLAYEISNLVLPCFFAFLFTIPVSVCVFGYASTYSPITNLILSPLLPATLALSLLSAIFCLTPLAFIYKPLLFLTKILISLICWFAEVFSKLPLSRIYVDSELTLPTVVVICILFLIAGLSKSKYKNSIKAALLSIPIICSAVLAHNMVHLKSTEIYFLESSAVVIESGGKRFVSGFATDSSYELNRLLDKSADKSILYLSSAASKNADISELTHFLLKNDVKTTAVNKKYLSTFSSLNTSSFKTECYSADGFNLKSGNIEISSSLSEGASLDMFNIGSFRIARLNVTSSNGLPATFDCDLLIANSKALPFIKNYKCRYFVLSEKLQNAEYVSEYLKDFGHKFLGDCDTNLILKNKKLYQINSFLK